MLASDEFRQSAADCPLQARPQRPEPGHFIDIDRLTETLDLGRA